MIDYFYYKEHLFLVTELLKDNLYEYSRYRACEASVLGSFANSPRLMRDRPSCACARCFTLAHAVTLAQVHSAFWRRALLHTPAAEEHHAAAP